MSLAPVVLFVYKRPWHTRQTVEALIKNKLAMDSELFVFSDAPEDDKTVPMVNEVREYIRTIIGFRKIFIIEQKVHAGLSRSIINGVTEVVNKYGSVIVLEDDLLTSTCFLEFMNDSLELYENDLNVASVHGYIYPIRSLPELFFIRGADCWGWATWKRAWGFFEPDGRKLLKGLQSKNLEREANFNNSNGYVRMLQDQIKGKNDSWAIRWYISVFLKDMLTLYPGKSYVQNIGNDNSGTHCKTTQVYEVELNCERLNGKIHVKENLEARKAMESFFNSFKKTMMQRIAFKIKGISR
ncbi:glycosyltransferase family 2 protein [Verrucomicrobiota bacterium]